MASMNRRRSPADAPRIVQDTDWKAMRVRYEEGESITVLADQLGISVSVVQAGLKAVGTRVQNGRFRTALPVTDDELRAAFAAGVTSTELAKQYGCSVSLVWRHLHYRTLEEPPAEPAVDADSATQQQCGAGPDRSVADPAALPVHQICAEYTAGATMRAIAERWNCDPADIRAIIKRGRTIRRQPPRRRRNITRFELIDLRDRQRLDWPEISARTGLPEDALRYRYKQDRL